MRPLLFIVALAACDTTEPPPLAADEQLLLGCWEGQQGTKTVQLRFHADRTVDTRIVPAGTWYTGTFSLAGHALTYDFGEEPPTYQIELSANELRYREPAFTFARIACPAT